MDCFDISTGLNSLVGVTLLVAGSNLMMNFNTICRIFGAFSFTLGYYIVGLAASGHKLGDLNLDNPRYLLGIGSVIAIVAGTFMLYYHVQDYIKKKLSGYHRVKSSLVKSIPIIVHLLMYGGLAGLVATISMKEDGSFNTTKALMASGAVLTIGYTKLNMLNSIGEHDSFQKHQLTHVLSWILFIISIAYTC